jgi:hypothetical protein
MPRYGPEPEGARFAGARELFAETRWPGCQPVGNQECPARPRPASRALPCRQTTGVPRRTDRALGVLGG